MISEFELKAGAAPKASGLKVQTTPITVFVGPNNSGKSRVLNEIEQYCLNGVVPQNSLLLAGLTFRPIAGEQAENLISKIRIPPNRGEIN